MRATIYVHYPTRDALLDAVTERALHETGRVIDAAEPQRGDPVEALRRVIAATWRHLGRYHALVAITTSRASSEEVHERHTPVLDQLLPLIQRGQASGAFGTESPPLAPEHAGRAHPRRQHRGTRWATSPTTTPKPPSWKQCSARSPRRVNNVAPPCVGQPPNGSNGDQTARTEANSGNLKRTCSARTFQPIKTCNSALGAGGRRFKSAVPDQRKPANRRVSVVLGQVRSAYGDPTGTKVSCRSVTRCSVPVRRLRGRARHPVLCR